MAGLVGAVVFGPAVLDRKHKRLREALRREYDRHGIGLDTKIGPPSGERDFSAEPSLREVFESPAPRQIPKLEAALEALQSRQYALGRDWTGSAFLRPLEVESTPRYRVVVDEEEGRPAEYAARREEARGNPSSADLLSGYEGF